MRIAIFILSLVNYFFRGFVLMKVWNWFPAMILGVPTISFTGALGFTMILLFFRTLEYKTKQELDERNRGLTNEDRISRALLPTAFYAAVLLVSWIISLFL